MERILIPLDKKSFLELANSLIEGAPLEQRVLEYKVKCGYTQKEGKEGRANLGTAYYKNFMRRHSKTLQAKKPRIIPKDRNDWATYENIDKMYDQLYQAMVDCGVARYMDENEVEVELINPRGFIMADEVGINTNQKDGGNRNQERLIGMAGGGSNVQQECAINDVRAHVAVGGGYTFDPTSVRRMTGEIRFPPW